MRAVGHRMRFRSEIIRWDDLAQRSSIFWSRTKNEQLGPSWIALGSFESKSK